MMASAYEGSCHCRSIEARLHWPQPAGSTPTRTCDCSFCTRHATVMISDPQAHLALSLAPGVAPGYRFGTESCDMLVCPRCGVFCAAVMMLPEGGALSVINARGLGLDAFLGGTTAVMSFGAETLENRIARRKQRWTPTELSFKP